MVVRLRLAMHGKRNNRIFHLVAINSPKRRNAKPIELLGVYDPRTKEGNVKIIEWNVSRIKQWLNNGAQPSERFVKLMEMGQILDISSRWHSKSKSMPSLSVESKFEPPASFPDRNLVTSPSLSISQEPSQRKQVDAILRRINLHADSGIARKNDTTNDVPLSRS